MLVYVTQLQDTKCGTITQMASPEITWSNFKCICSDTQLVYGVF